MRLKRKRLPASPLSSTFPSSFGEEGPPRNRSQVVSTSYGGAVGSWRYRVIPAKCAVSMPVVGDKVLEAYEREMPRRLADAIGNDSLYRRTFGRAALRWK